MVRSRTIIDLVPERCIASPVRHIVERVKHEIIITGSKDLIDDIIRQTCELRLQEALSVIQRYVQRCSYSERRAGVFEREIILNVELSDGSRNAYVQVRVELGSLQNFIALLILDWRTLLSQYCVPRT